VLAILLFGSLALAQQKPRASKASLPSIPVFDVKLSPDQNVSIPLADSMPVISTQCDDDGNPYIKTFGPDGLQILGITPKGIIAFATNQMTDIPQPTASNFFVGSTGFYILVRGIENARKEEVIEKDEQGREWKRLKTKGESIDYIARFDRDGSYRGSLKLDNNFHPMQLAAFSSGTFVIAGLDEDRIPRVGLFNSGGQLVKYLQLPKDITDDPKRAEKSFANSELSASVDVIAMLAQLYPYNGNVLLVRAGSATPIYEIRESGEVWPVRVKIPNGLTVDHLIPSDRNWFLDVRTSSLADKSDTVYEIDPADGEPLRQYRIESKDELEEALSCEAQDSFSGIRHQHGTLTLLHGTAEPAAQKQPR
jgi:hypothetical protein